MRKCILSLVVIITAICAFQEGQANNRFNVLTFGDASTVTNRQQFYQWLDEWGASIVHTSSDTVSRYILLDSLGFVISASHFLKSQQLYLNDTVSESNKS